MANGVGGRVSPATSIDLPVDVGNVTLYGSDAQDEFLGDLPVTFAPGY